MKEIISEELGKPADDPSAKQVKFGRSMLIGAGVMGNGIALANTFEHGLNWRSAAVNVALVALSGYSIREGIRGPKGQ